MKLPTADLLRKIGFQKPPWAHRYIHARVTGCLTLNHAPLTRKAQGARCAERLMPLIHVVRKLLINPDHTNPMAAEQATLRAGRGARTAGSSRDDVSRDYQWCCLLCYTTEWPKQRFEPLEGVREILAAREKEVKRHFNVSMDGDAARKEARR